MNKNTKNRLAIARSNAQKGNRTTVFAIPQTMQGSSIGARNLTINIGGNTENRSRNMRQVINSNPGDSRTFHEIIDKERAAITTGKVNNRKQEGAGSPKTVKVSSSTTSRLKP